VVGEWACVETLRSGSKADSVPGMPDTIPLETKNVRLGAGTLSAMPPECCPPSFRNRVRHGPVRAVISRFDADQQAAATQRRRILALAAERDYWVAGAHLSFPGIGHVRATEESYRWVPVNYTIPR
jgi:hypothetical protein